MVAKPVWLFLVTLFKHQVLAIFPVYRMLSLIIRHIRQVLKVVLKKFSAVL